MGMGVGRLGWQRRQGLSVHHMEIMCMSVDKSKSQGKVTERLELHQRSLAVLINLSAFPQH